ncbi:MAG: hypothetical protein JSW58_06520 [Candidatus Latescibacterota bacterium]|nr:MAG: hypothetical protein JSW58_06520 [Candidatus Latescibacterota bacterium]
MDTKSVQRVERARLGDWRWWLWAISVSLLLFSCSDDATCPTAGEDQKLQELIVRDIDYIARTYFFLDNPELIVADFEVLPREGSIDVYRSVEEWWVVAESLDVAYGAAYIDSIGDGSEIGTGDGWDQKQFELLRPGEDYRFILDPHTEDVLGIELTRALWYNEALAVAYVNMRGDTIGDFGKPFSYDENNPLLLELVWPAYAFPDGPFGYTWSYMIRNNYNMGVTNIDPRSLEVEIHEYANRVDTWRPESSSIPWIRIFGLDQTDDTGVGPPDGKVDLTRGVIDLVRGILTFPSLTPFDPDSALVEYWTDGEFAFTGQYADLKNPELYTDHPESQSVQSKFSIVIRHEPR